MLARVEVARANVETVRCVFAPSRNRLELELEAPGEVQKYGLDIVQLISFGYGPAKAIVARFVDHYKHDGGPVSQSRLLAPIDLAAQSLSAEDLSNPT